MLPILPLVSANERHVLTPYANYSISPHRSFPFIYPRRKYRLSSVVVKTSHRRIVVCLLDLLLTLDGHFCCLGGFGATNHYSWSAVQSGMGKECLILEGRRLSRMYDDIGRKWLSARGCVLGALAGLLASVQVYHFYLRSNSGGREWIPEDGFFPVGCPKPELGEERWRPPQTASAIRFWDLSGGCLCFCLLQPFF